MEVSSRYITIKTHVQGSAYESDFELKVASLGRSAEPGSDEIILRNLFVSIDPAQINRMKSYSSSQKSVKTESGIIPGQVYHHFIITVQLDAAKQPSLLPPFNHQASLTCLSSCLYKSSLNGCRFLFLSRKRNLFS
jgi:hypothetical protein